MVSACRVPGEADERTFCMACMDGDYPTGDIDTEVLDRIEAERLDCGAGLDG